MIFLVFCFCNDNGHNSDDLDPVDDDKVVDDKFETA
jgi:hypothetical protein